MAGLGWAELGWCGVGWAWGGVGWGLVAVWRAGWLTGLVSDQITMYIEFGNHRMLGCLGWACPCEAWKGCWARLGWAGLDWTALGWAGLGLAGL